MIDEPNSPATQGNIAELRTELKGDIAELRTELKGDIAELRTGLADQKDELIETLRDVQTEVLRAFYGFTQTIQERFKAQDDTETALKRRMTTLESRILEVEKRLNMPPNAA